MRFASCKPSAYKENENKEQREFILDHIWGTSTKRDLEEREWKYAGITEGNWVERRGKICIPIHLEERRKGYIIWRPCSPGQTDWKRSWQLWKSHVPQIWGAAEDCLHSTRRCWEKGELVSHVNICFPKHLQK